MKLTDELPTYLSELDLSVLGDVIDGVRYSSHMTAEGESMHVYELGDPAAEKLVLLPPYGVTYLLIARLAKILSSRFHVISWESKGCPDASVAFDDTDLALTHQAATLCHFLEQREIVDFHFIGWCQAAQLAVQAIATQVIAPKTVCWIAPAGLGCALLQSEFDRCALPIYREIAERGVEHAAMLSTILDKHRNEPLNAEIAAEKLTMLHLSDPAVTLRFSKYMKLYEDNTDSMRELLEQALALQPILIIHSKDDTFSHYSESVQLAKLSNNITLQLIDSGGHLQVFNEPDISAALIRDFIDEAVVPAMPASDQATTSTIAA